jgi:MSHA biogenesis protein MshK
MWSGSVRSRYSVLIVSGVLLFGPLPTDGAELLRDPTRPYSSTPVVVISARDTSFRVTAIFISEKRRVAIVNGQRVREGDQVNGATVVEILANNLRLNLRGKEFTTRLLPDAVRK